MSGRLQFLKENLNKCVGLDVEVVLVHDHFDEATCQEIRVISDGISPLVNIKLLETEKRVVSEARNLGMKSASGAWIAFVDSDDQFIPSLYVEMVIGASKEGNEIAVGNFTKFDLLAIAPSASYVSRAVAQNANASVYSCCPAAL